MKNQLESVPTINARGNAGQPVQRRLVTPAPTNQLIAQRKLQAAANHSRPALTKPAKADCLQKMVDGSARMMKQQAQVNVIQRTIDDALEYYNNKTGKNAKKESQVDFSLLKTGEKGHFTKLKNKKAAGRKVGSRNGVGKYRIKVPRSQMRVRVKSTKGRFSRSERRRDARSGKYSGLNYATAKLRLTDRTAGSSLIRYLTGKSQMGKAHSERDVQEKIRLLNKQYAVDTEWLYTEREACGPDNHNCRGDKTLGDTSIFSATMPTYYSVDWPDSRDGVSDAKASRHEGTNLIKRLDTQVRNDNNVHDYPTEMRCGVELQMEDDGAETSDDESEDEMDILRGGYGGARRNYKEMK